MASEPGCKVFIGNINENVRKSELRHEFEKFGEVMDVYISNGYAFVTFAQSDSASSAIRDMDGTMYMGEKLRVEISRGRANSDRRGGGHGGPRGSDMGRRGGGGGGMGGGRRDRPPPGGSFPPYSARRDDFRDARSGIPGGGDKGGRGFADRGYGGRDGAGRYDRRDGPPLDYHRSTRGDSGRDFDRRRSFTPPLPPRSYSDELGGFAGSRSRPPPYGGASHRGPITSPRRGGHFDDRRRLSPPLARFERDGGFPRRSPLPAPHSRRDEIGRRPMTPPSLPASRFRSRSPMDRHSGPSRAEYSDRRGPDLRDSRPSFGRGGRGGRPRPDSDYDRGSRGGGGESFGGGRGRGGGGSFRDDRGPPPLRSGGGPGSRHRSPRPRY